MTVMARADEFVRAGHRLTLIGPDPYHYYSGMGPGMLAGHYRPQDIRFNVKKMVETRGGEFIRGRVVKIIPDKKVLLLDSGRAVEYDIASFNVGSDVSRELIMQEGGGVYTVKPIINLYRARNAILDWKVSTSKKERPLRVVVVGGGPAGVEVAGCVRALIRERGLSGEVSLVAGSVVAKRLPERARGIIRKNFRKRGIRIFEGVRSQGISNGLVRLSDGRELPADITFLATGIRPPSLFRDSGLATGPHGGLLVNRFLQSVDYPDIFGGGDCIHFSPSPLEKVGVYAVRENPVLFHNLLSMAEGKALMEFDPGPPYLLIFNLGEGRGLYWKKERIFDGRIAFLIKDYIDRKFMKKFQLSGESLEDGGLHEDSQVL